MAIRFLRCAFAAAVFCVVPHAAAQQNPALPFDPQNPLGGIVREDDVPVLFDYLREAWVGAMEGRSVPVPDEVQRRAEAIGTELRGRAAVGGVLLLNIIEHNLSGLLREPPDRAAPAAPGAL